MGHCWSACVLCPIQFSVRENKRDEFVPGYMATFLLKPFVFYVCFFVHVATKPGISKPGKVNHDFKVSADGRLIICDEEEDEEEGTKGTWQQGPSVGLIGFILPYNKLKIIVLAHTVVWVIDH